MPFENLRDPAVQATLREAKTPEELLEIAREKGFELSDEQVQAVAGGMEWRCTDQACGDYFPCPADLPTLK